MARSTIQPFSRGNKVTAFPRLMAARPLAGSPKVSKPLAARVVKNRRLLAPPAAAAEVASNRPEDSVPGSRLPAMERPAAGFCRGAGATRSEVKT
jgi:hypothetical protein